MAIDNALSIIATHENILISSLQEDDFFAKETVEHYSAIGVEEVDVQVARSVECPVP